MRRLKQLKGKPITRESERFTDRRNAKAKRMARMKKERNPNNRQVEWGGVEKKSRWPTGLMGHVYSCIVSLDFFLLFFDDDVFVWAFWYRFSAWLNVSVMWSQMAERVSVDSTKISVTGFAEKREPTRKSRTRWVDKGVRDHHASPTHWFCAPSLTVVSCNWLFVWILIFNFISLGCGIEYPTKSTSGFFAST